MRPVALLLLVGCVHSQETICSDGSVCPSALRCDLVHHTCVTSDQLTACEDLPDGSDCALSDAVGVCDAGVCLRQLCGDGIITGAEECDGNTASCLDIGYYDDVPLLCSNRCTFDEIGSQCTGFCGDGQVNGDELCDESRPAGSCLDVGFDRGTLGCNDFCAPRLTDCARIGFIPQPVISSDTVWALALPTDDRMVLVTQTGIIDVGPNGTTTTPTDPLYAIWGATPNDMHAVGYQGAIWHYDGTWTQTRSSVLGEDLRDVWGSSATNVLAVGNSGRILRNTGSGWSLHSGGNDAWNWYGITGWNATNYVVVGSHGRIHRVVNDVPQTQDVSDCFAGSSFDIFLDVWASSPTDIFAVGTQGMVCHFDGVSWTRQFTDVSDDLRAVWGRSPTDVFAVGMAGQVVHYDGAEWRPITIESASDFFAIAQRGNRLVIAGSFGELREYASSAIATMPTFFTADHASALSAGNEYVFNDSQLFRWIDGAWTNVLTTAGGLGGTWFGVDGTVIAYDNFEEYRFDGTSWSSPTVRTFRAGLLAGSSPSDLFGLSYDNNGTVGHFDGATWTTIPSPSGLALVDLAAADGIAFVVGISGADVWILTCTSTQCTPTQVTPRGPPGGIWAASATDVFLVDQKGGITHYDGTTWSAMDSGTASALYDVHGTSGSDVFAVGVGGTVLHYDGSSWSRVRVPPAMQYTAVSARSDVVLLVSATLTRAHAIVRDDSW